PMGRRFALAEVGRLCVQRLPKQDCAWLIVDWLPDLLFFPRSVHHVSCISLRALAHGVSLAICHRGPAVGSTPVSRLPAVLCLYTESSVERSRRTLLLPAGRSRPLSECLCGFGDCSCGAQIWGHL